MIFRLSLRELRRFPLFFLLCFLAVFLCAAISHLGLRAIFSAVQSPPDAQTMLRIEGGFLFTAGILSCFSLLFLAFLAIPLPFRRDLGYLRKTGAGPEHFTLLFLLQTLLFGVPAAALGIGSGELLLRCAPAFPFGIQLTHGAAAQSIFFVFFVFILLFLLLPVCTGFLSFHEKTARCRRLPEFLRLRERSVLPVSIPLGALSFLRRRRPLPLLGFFCLICICLIAYTGALSYTMFRNETTDRCIYDLEVRFSADERSAWEDAIDAVSDRPHAAWRVYLPHEASGRTLFPDENIEVNVLSEADFHALAQGLPLHSAAQGRRALLQNRVYDERFREERLIQDTALPITGNLSKNIPVTVIGFLDEVPARYASGYADMVTDTYRLFVTESEFREYGENDMLLLRLSGANDADTQHLKELFEQRGDNVRELNDAGELLGMSVGFVKGSLILLAPVALLTFILFLCQDLRSRSGETDLLRSLGMQKTELAAAIAVDHLLLAALLCCIILIPSVILLRAIHFSAIGYYAPFFLPRLI